MTRGEIEKFLIQQGIENPAPALIDFCAVYLEVRDSIIKREMEKQAN